MLTGEGWRKGSTAAPGGGALSLGTSATPPVGCLSPAVLAANVVVGSYFFLVGSLVQHLDDLLGELVVSSGPDATSLGGLDHSVFLCLQ